MIYWTYYKSHNFEIVGKKQKYDNTIYSFDIETTSYLVYNNKQYNAKDYEKLPEYIKKDSEKKSCMYIWMFSINDVVYYGRTWQEFKVFIEKIDNINPYKKIIFIHNLSFEFQYLKGYFNFEDVFARKSRKVIKCIFEDYNIELRCTYVMSNCALSYLPELFKLPVRKLTGNLDYTKIRTPLTELTEKELEYCENDCLVIYYYILEELKTYETVNKIPITSTGHVRRELKEKIANNWKYKSQVKKAVDTNPYIYNLLVSSFAGGYTHANWIYADTILNNIVSFDFTSSYPYVMVTHKFPMTKFLKCNIKYRQEMSKRFAYLLKIKLKNVKSKFYNNFLSLSKCFKVKNGRYDNGRIISCDYLETTVTDIDFYLILDSYYCEYEIEESYYSLYKYLPKDFIEFILDKYVIKTKYKGIEEKAIDYAKEKNKFNSLYGMAVTNTIKDKVIFENQIGWSEEELTDEEIKKALISEEKQAFLSFAWGVWVTAYARNNLIRNIMKLDEYLIYCDTDSIKLKQGYDKNVILNYNKFVENKIKIVSKKLDIPIERFAPKDINGKSHMLGLFEQDEHYESFITQGAKKYAFTKYVDNKKVNKNTDNILKEEKEKSLILGITVARCT